MNPNSLVANGNAQAEGLYNQNQSILPSIGNNASLGSTTQQAQDALNQTASAPVTPAVAAPHTSLLERLLPTIGGIGGAILGAPLDPLTGGLASVGLSGLLSGAGKAGENALTGQKVLQGNDLVSAGEGALGQGIGKGVGAVLNGVGKTVTGVGTNMADNAAQAATDADTQAANEAAIKNTANAYKDVPPAIQKLYNAKDSIAHVNDMGFDGNDPNNLLHVANTTNDALNSNLDQALGNSGPVDLSNYNDMVKQAINEEDPNGNILGSYSPIAVSKGRFGPSTSPAGKVLSQLENMGAGVAKTNGDPNEIRTLTTNLFNAAQDAKPTITAATGAVDPAQRSIYNIINNVRNQVKGALYDRPEVNDALAKIEPNLTAEDTGSQQLADHINNIIGNAGKSGGTPAQDYLSEISKNIDVGNLGKEGLDAQQVVTSTGGQARAAAEAGIPVTTTAAKQSPINMENGVNLASLAEGTLGHHPLALAIPLAMKAAENPTVVQGVGKGLSAVGSSAAPGILGSVLGNSPNDVAAPADASSAITQGNTMNPQDSPLYQALQQDLTMGKEAEADPYLAGSYSGATSSLPGLIQAVQKVNEAQNAAQNLQSNYNLAGGAQGPLGGILSRLGATFTGGEAGQYGGQAQADAQAIAQATGVPVQQVASSLPKLGENQSAAQASLGNIQSLIQALLQGQSSPGIVATAQQ